LSDLFGLFRKPEIYNPNFLGDSSRNISEGFLGFLVFGHLDFSRREILKESSGSWISQARYSTGYHRDSSRIFHGIPHRFVRVK